MMLHLWLRLSFSSCCAPTLNPKMAKSGRKTVVQRPAWLKRGYYYFQTCKKYTTSAFCFLLSSVFCLQAEIFVASLQRFFLAPAAPESFLLLNKLRIWRPPKKNYVQKRSVFVGVQQRGPPRFVAMGPLRPFSAFTTAPARQNQPSLLATCASGGPS